MVPALPFRSSFSLKGGNSTLSVLNLQNPFSKALHPSVSICTLPPTTHPVEQTPQGSYLACLTWDRSISRLARRTDCCWEDMPLLAITQTRASVTAFSRWASFRPLSASWGAVAEGYIPGQRIKKPRVIALKTEVMCSAIRHMCAKSLQSCLTLCDPMDYSLPGLSAHEILQARIPEWVVMPSSRGSSLYVLHEGGQSGLGCSDICVPGETLKAWLYLCMLSIPPRASPSLSWKGKLAECRQTQQPLRGLPGP